MNVHLPRRHTSRAQLGAGMERGGSTQPRLPDTEFPRLPGPEPGPVVFKPAHMPHMVEQRRGPQGWMEGVPGRRFPHSQSEMCSGVTLSVSRGGCGFGHVGGTGQNQH